MLALPPEIIDIIYHFIEIQDIARLAQRYCAMIDLVVPYLWQDVRAESLLALLPSIHFDHNKPIGKFGL